MTNAELLDLLREAEYCLNRAQEERYSDLIEELLPRINAALAEPVVKPLVKPPSTTWARFAYAFREQAERAERERDEVYAEIKRLTAELAKRQEFATEGVEWREFNEEVFEAYPDNHTELEAARLGNGTWRWSVNRKRAVVGYCTTESEAKEAAIAAARGMR
jgi:hypothetical protein